jgi:hypothetical protein
MFKFFLRTFFILEILTSLLFPSSKEENLSQKYKDWLKIVSYIILPQEKEIFLKLESDRDRDIFIEAFWKQRDPTPGTPENEFKEEHYRRFLYANEHFKRGTSREGWMTDMGRIYIILGPPNSIERLICNQVYTLVRSGITMEIRRRAFLPNSLLYSIRGEVSESISCITQHLMDQKAFSLILKE